MAHSMAYARLLAKILTALVCVSFVLPSIADAQRRRRRRGPGHIVIQTPVEGAEVLIDEELVGYTPLDPIEASPGDHTIRVRRPGFTEFDDVITVEPGQDAEVFVDLIALAMVVTFRSTPDEAQVFVDGTFRGQTPIELELIEGEHSVRIVAPLFHENVQTITATPGEVDLIEVTLEELPEELINPPDPEWYEEPLTWILVSAGAAVVAAVIIVVVVLTGQGSAFQDFCGPEEQDCLFVARPAWNF